LNSGLCLCYAGALQLEPHLQAPLFLISLHQSCQPPILETHLLASKSLHYSDPLPTSVSVFFANLIAPLTSYQNNLLFGGNLCSQNKREFDFDLPLPTCKTCLLTSTRFKSPLFLHFW
jgi:hypothetical protein